MFYYMNSSYDDHNNAEKLATFLKQTEMIHSLERKDVVAEIESGIRNGTANISFCLFTYFPFSLYT